MAESCNSNLQQLKAFDSTCLLRLYLYADKYYDNNSRQTVFAVSGVVCAEVVVTQTISDDVARGRKLYLCGCAVESGSGKTRLTTFLSRVSVSHFTNDVALYRQRVGQTLERTTSVARYKDNSNFKGS